jgi:hypothetical protein
MSGLTVESRVEAWIDVLDGMKLVIEGVEVQVVVRCK